MWLGSAIRCNRLNISIILFKITIFDAYVQGLGHLTHNGMPDYGMPEGTMMQLVGARFLLAFM